ncbi:MAG: hypothetical protein DRN05_03365, partial [Thermoplasmata archaeon]
TLINVPKNSIPHEWKAKEYTIVEGDDPYQIASKIALNDWEYSDNAVIAVIQKEFEKPENHTQRVISGKFPANLDVKIESFRIVKTNKINPQYKEFVVPEGYKFIKARCWYPSFYLNINPPIPGFESAVRMTIPPGDRDIQLYCYYDGNWMQVQATEGWNAQEGMDTDKTSSYVYKSGKWRVGLTDTPTKNPFIKYFSKNSKSMDLNLEPQKKRSLLRGIIEFGRYGKLIDVLRNLKEVNYKIDIEMYPGTQLEIPDIPPFGCRNVKFKLSWDNPNVQLGFSIIGPSGEEIFSSLDKKNVDPTEIHLSGLGECPQGEKYRICVFTTEKTPGEPFNFKIEYSWDQNFSRTQGDLLASATEGAILASILNSPLLYVSPSKLPSSTIDALQKLGVKKIYVVDLGKHMSIETKDKLRKIASIKEYYEDYQKIYDVIMKKTSKNDIIFSTINPWDKWQVGVLKPGEETPNALFIGPAAYIAAHHGSPVLLIDNHPELSSAAVWHTEFWRKHSNGLTDPSVASMYLTAKRVYNFLDKYGFDQNGAETIITIAGQYELGFSWDRAFVGKAMPGRFFGSPVDISYWITRNIFYPALIFQNPAATSVNGVELINGSKSHRRFPFWGKLGLKIDRPSQKELLKYPVLDTLICYEHRFNERASKYWGFKYITADGKIPGESISMNPIDEGVMEKINGEKGAFVPDLSCSEVQPFYLKKAGYNTVFSTNFDANMYNLNKGVLLWMVNTHGGPFNGGLLMFWDVAKKNPQGYPPIPLAGYNKETNPWRAYEWLMGSTAEPDTMTSEIHGVLPALFGNPNPRGLRFLITALDWAWAKKPYLDLVSKIANLPLIRFFAPEWLKDTDDYYDGVIITVLLGRFGTSWYNGIQIDDALDNIHSVGVSSVACLPAGKYLHLTLVRHGSVFQIMDPWPTSWYSSVWQDEFPRGIALGQTIGEIYKEGVSKVGILYVNDPEPQWWWDIMENVVLFGDPNLRIWSPSTKYSSKNHWTVEDVQPLRYDVYTDFNISGHTPFGAKQHPHEKIQSIWEQYLWIIIIIVIIIAALVASVLIRRRR